MSGGSLPPGYPAVLESLYARKPRGAKLGIDRMRLLAAELGNPEFDLPVIHIGGTNGKGSVAAMVEAILRAAGWTVGLYTSPHLVHLGERVQVDRQPVSPAEIMAYLDELNPVAARIARKSGVDDQPSFFELMTAMAFLHFGRKACDVAVIEVGLGGEFDATNVVLPEVSVLTSVGLDHCEWLGNTIEQIARTKAGIIKPRRPIVIGRLPKTAERIVRETASWHDAPVISVRERFGETIDAYPDTNLEGEYQRWNAATAELAVRALSPRWRIDDAVIRAGLDNVDWPGRWQHTEAGGRSLILDASHNPEGAEVLEMNLTALVRQSGVQPIVVVGVLGTERAGPLLASICRHAREVYLVVPRQPRASSWEELQSLIPPTFRGAVHRSTVELLFPGGNACQVGAKGDVVVVTGSIYLLAEVMTRLELRGAA